MSAPEPAAPPLHLRVHYDNSVPVLVIPDELPFAELREWVRSRMPDALADIGGRASRLHLGERQIQLFDVRRLVHMLRDEFGVEVTGLYVRPSAVHRYAERELKLKLFQVDDDGEFGEAEPEPEPDAQLPGLAALVAALESAPEPPPEEADQTADAVTEETPVAVEVVEAPLMDAEPLVFQAMPAQRRDIPLPDLPDEEPQTDADGGRPGLTITRTLRSGATIRYEGDVTIYGDVNPGAVVKASGNILVLGRLRGVVHAGAAGNDGAHILAFEMAPTQLRVGKHIAIATARNSGGKGFHPEIATVVDGSIIIESYRGRLRR